ncbi:D-methionine-binding lipoprotein MetQ [Rhodovastum atsumiense]|uniref:Lipoprotein n=1 Tax=Rhodovastum atsumiense TaxID=504468 RepID=A0A5M6J0L6_9PROT|nr:MetQ/NlpA family lipoprotein [Rhodovastum atsumiense]KAA5614051.1 metal ABC transporter substrate-binding protein [Rhodovastum atsumiense]CAH2598865.1 D-methionine-binding lipoprotein MetQ [Rhodovastum atsumiense]
MNSSFPRTSRRTLLALSIAALALANRPAIAADPLRVGVMAGDGEVIFAAVAAEAKKRGLDIKVVPFSDYTLPNEALERGDLDANAFQHVPYLENQSRTRGYHLVPVGYTVVAPIGLYSHKVRAAADLPAGGRIGVPNDPSNGGRALLLLQAQGVIRLRDGVGILPKVTDIVENPKKLKIIELDAGIIGRSIDDLDAGVVNTDWAIKSGLDLARDRIASEAVEGNPYRNVIAVRQGRENDPRVRTLVVAYQTESVRRTILETWKGATLPAW